MLKLTNIMNACKLSQHSYRGSGYNVKLNGRPTFELTDVELPMHLGVFNSFV